MEGKVEAIIVVLYHTSVPATVTSKTVSTSRQQYLVQATL